MFFYLIFFIFSISSYSKVPFVLNAGPYVLPVMKGKDTGEESQIVCLEQIKEASRLYDIPPYLLRAISIVESGYTYRGRYGPWPWVLNINGVARFFRSKNEAYSVLSEGLKKGYTIDVGPMQINVSFHAKNFKNPQDMLDIKSNVYYAAAFLRKLYEAHGCWIKAVKAYHGNTEPLKIQYVKRVGNFLPYNLAQLNNYNVPRFKWPSK